MNEYEKWLERAKEKMPEVTKYKGRFSPPKVKSFIEGNRTYITNLKEISNYLNRDINHIVKFLAKELATSFVIEGNRIIINGKHPNRKLEEKIEKYIKVYVICRECGSPDTKLEKKDGILYLKCMACQAEYPVPKI